MSCFFLTPLGTIACFHPEERSGLLLLLLLPSLMKLLPLQLAISQPLGKETYIIRKVTGDTKVSITEVFLDELPKSEKTIVLQGRKWAHTSGLRQGTEIMEQAEPTQTAGFDVFSSRVWGARQKPRMAFLMTLRASTSLQHLICSLSWHVSTC